MHASRLEHAGLEIETRSYGHAIGSAIIVHPEGGLLRNVPTVRYARRKVGFGKFRELWDTMYSDERVTSDANI